MAKTIIHDEEGNMKWGTEDHLSVAQNRSFASMIFELLSEKVPTDPELKIFELILNLSIDHGSDTPSAIKVIEEAKEGEDISESVAEGIEQINDSHGGAGEPLMKILYQVIHDELSVADLVQEYLKEGKRMPGLGHRIYKGDDPRVVLIFEKMAALGMGEEFIQKIKEIQDELEKQKGLRLPVNIDGAIAVVLCTFGWDSKFGKAVFIIARTPGLCAHYLNNS
jgi:citryl-CoA lyase